jgi:hypothetical protein
MKPSPRTTDPLLAIQALLSSEEPNPAISYDGLLYHIRDAEEKPDKGSFQILSLGQAKTYMSNYRLAFGFELQQGELDTSKAEVAQWMEDNADTWLASARLASSWEDPSTQIDTALRAISHD